MPFAPAAGPVPVVALHLPTGPALADAIIRAWDAGQAALPLDPALPEPELRRLLDELRPERVVDAAGERALRGPEPASPGVAAILPTSGTSGPPKGVELTHANLDAAARASRACLGAEPGDRWLCCLPLHHVGGVGILARSLVAGVDPIVHEGFDPAAVGREREATLMSLVPTMLVRLLDAGADLRRFRRILLGGAPATPALRRRAAAAGANVVVTYGSTETTGGVVYDGLPLDGVRVKVDAERNGEEGPISIAGPTVMAGYKGRPELTAQAVRDGWFRTSDIGRWDGEGRLVVLGRADDVIVTGGRKVVPQEVEAVLAEHPGVAEVVVAGVADAEWGQRVTAFVVPKGDAPRLEELRALAGRRLAPHKAPRALELVDALPRTASGKPLRRALAGSLREADGGRR